MGKAGRSRPRRKSLLQKQVSANLNKTTPLDDPVTGQSCYLSSQNDSQVFEPIRHTEKPSTSRIGASPQGKQAPQSKRPRKEKSNISISSNEEFSDKGSVYSVKVTNRFNALNEEDIVMETNKTEGEHRKPPPIVISGHIERASSFFKDLKKAISENIEIKCVSKVNFCKTYIKTQTISDYKIIVNILKSSNVQFYTYGLKDEIPSKVILKGLHPTITTSEINEELTELGFPPADIVHFNKKGTDMKIPVFLLTFEPKVNLRDIFGIKVLCYTKIFWEKYRGNNRPLQCYRCQSFFHISTNCHLNLKCLKCSGNHRVQDCVAPTTFLKCANCDLNHAANDPICKVKIASIERKNRNRNYGYSNPVPNFASPQQFPKLNYSKAVANQAEGVILKNKTPSNESRLPADPSSSSFKNSNADAEILSDFVKILSIPYAKNLIEKLIRIFKLLSQAKNGSERLAILLEEGLSILS